MTPLISSPHDRVQRINVEIGRETKSVWLYAPDSTLTQSSFERRGDAVKFAIREGTPRIAQFANKPSSRQRQGSHAVRLPGSGSLSVDLSREAGSYDAGCQLCLQIYDAAHVFLTQLRIPLAAEKHRIEAKLPKNAALGCFSTQLSGSGVIDTIAVRLAASGGPDAAQLAIAEGLDSADELLALLEASRRNGADLARLRETLSAQPLFVIASCWKWYTEAAYYSLVELMRVSTPWRETDDIGRVTASLMYLCARGLSKLNAVASSLEVLDALEATPDWRTLLSAREVQNVLLLRGQALVRTGRPEEGVAAFDVARLNEPLHWEAYHLLSNNLDEQHAPLKEAYLQAAISLREDQHPKLSIAVVENDLRNDRWSSGLAKGLEDLVKLEAPNDVGLALANAYLQIGDVASWRRFVGRHFEQFGLSAPEFDTSAAADAARFPLTPEPAGFDDVDRGQVAVIMTTYNSEKTLEFAARSVLAQTYRRINLVIVDDASSDGTTDIARSLAERDSRVTLISNQTNAGTYVCKNIALSRVRADYFAFHDSDDWMHPEHIARHLDVMERDGAACTTSVWFRMEIAGRIVARHAGGYQHANPASIFIRKEVLDTVGYFDSVRTGADTEFVWRIRNLYPRDQIVEIELPLAIGLFHDASLTQSGVTAFNRHRYSAVRLAYWESWVRWHLETLTHDRSKLKLPFPMERRPFWAPPAITPGGAQTDVADEAPAERSLFASHALTDH